MSIMNMHAASTLDLTGPWFSEYTVLLLKPDILTDAPAACHA